MTRQAPLWLRNAIAAAVACAALAVLVTVQLWPQWSSYRATVVPQHVAPAGAAITVDGQTWQIGSLRREAGIASAGAPPPPAGTSLVVITVLRSGTGGELGCVGMLTDGARRWSPDVMAAAPLAPGATSLCSLPGPLQLSFVVPADATLRALDVTAPDGRIQVRLQL